MKVKELIEKLQKCDQEAEVNVEVFMDPEVRVVGEYHLDDGECEETVVYIGDRLDAVTDFWEDDGIEYTAKLYVSNN